MTSVKDEARKRYLEVQQAVGEVAMMFSQLDELLRDVLCILVNPSNPDPGFVVFDQTSGHKRKVELIQGLVDTHYSVHDPTTGKRMADLPQEYLRLTEVLGKVKEAGSERNRITHDVYDCWIGEKIVIQRRSLKRGHENRLIAQKDSRQEVSPKTIHEHAVLIHTLTGELKNAAQVLLTKN